MGGKNAPDRADYANPDLAWKVSYGAVRYVSQRCTVRVFILQGAFTTVFLDGFAAVAALRLARPATGPRGAAHSCDAVDKGAIHRDRKGEGAELR